MGRWAASTADRFTNSRMHRIGKQHGTEMIGPGLVGLQLHAYMGLDKKHP